MKFLLLTVLLSGIGFTSVSQNIKKELLSNTWHGQGWFKDKTVALSKSDAKSEWQLKFLETGLAKYLTVVKEKGYDEKGKVVLPGDTIRASYKYTLKNNVIYFNAPHGNYYFKVNKLANEEGFELVSANKSDFK